LNFEIGITGMCELVGNLRVVSCAPPVVLHDPQLLLSSAKNQLKAVKAYNVEDWKNTKSTSDLTGGFSR
jgi:hypothetical protein